MPGPGPGRKGCASCWPLAQDGPLQQPAALSSPPTGPSKPSTGSRPHPEVARVHTRAQARVTKRGLHPDRHGLSTSDNKESPNSWGASGRCASRGPHPGRSTPTSQTLGPPVPKHRARRQPASTRYRRLAPRGRLRAREGSGRAQGNLTGWGGRCRAQTSSLSSCLRGRGQGRHWQLAPSPAQLNALLTPLLQDARESKLVLGRASPCPRRNPPKGNPNTIPNAPRLTGRNRTCSRARQRGRGAAAGGAEIPGRWHHQTSCTRRPGCTVGGERRRGSRPPSMQRAHGPGHLTARPLLST